jgi:hypothetical protein
VSVRIDVQGARAGIYLSLRIELDINQDQQAKNEKGEKGDFDCSNPLQPFFVLLFHVMKKSQI